MVVMMVVVVVISSVGLNDGSARASTSHSLLCACGRRSAQLCGWIEITVLFLKNPPPPDQLAGQIGHITSKLFEFKGFRCGQRWMDNINRNICSRRGGRHQLRDR